MAQGFVPRPDGRFLEGVPDEAAVAGEAGHEAFDIAGVERPGVAGDDIADGKIVGG